MTTVEVMSEDTGMRFTDTLKLDGVVVNLTGATVYFVMKLVGPPNTAYFLAAEIVDAVAGTVKYEPGVGYPTALGTYRHLWRVVDSNGKILSFANNDYNIIKIKDNLGIISS